MNQAASRASRIIVISLHTGGQSPCSSGSTLPPSLSCGSCPTPPRPHQDRGALPGGMKTAGPLGLRGGASARPARHKGRARGHQNLLPCAGQCVHDSYSTPHSRTHPSAGLHQQSPARTRQAGPSAHESHEDGCEQNDGEGARHHTELYWLLSTIGIKYNTRKKKINDKTSRFHPTGFEPVT